MFVAVCCANVHRNRLLTLGPTSVSFRGSALAVGGDCRHLNNGSVVAAPGAPGDGHIVVLPRILGAILRGCVRGDCNLRPSSQLFPCGEDFLCHRVRVKVRTSKMGHVEIRSVHRDRTDLLIRLNFSLLLVTRHLRRRQIRAAVSACDRLCSGGRIRMTGRLSGLTVWNFNCGGSI